MPPFLIMLVLCMLVGVPILAVQLVAMAARGRRRSIVARQELRIADGGYPGWRQGEDLLRYPERLATMERTLQTSLAELEGQRAHLLDRRDKVAAKEDRVALASRYDEDAALLARRIDRVRRVLALVWRTRTVLLLRAHVAITARARPHVEALPEGEIPAARLEAAARAYEEASERVRAFVASIGGREVDLSLQVSRPPSEAVVEPDDERAVSEELASARGTYADLGRRMDGLADTLAYLADRCRTRRVVEGASLGLDAEPGGGQLIEELNGALGALHDLAELGDQALADSALDSLTENIETLSRIEKAGLDAKAEADAAIEVGKLLSQFPRA